MQPFLIPVFASVDAILIPIVALLVPIVIVPTALALRLAQRRREMDHRERMRALELGWPLPGSEADATPVRVALKLGAGVPVGVMGIAWLASMTMHDRDLAQGAWVGASLVSVIAVLCGSALMMKAFHLASQRHQSSSGYAAAPKPAFDPDAYDHVGTRG